MRLHGKQSKQPTEVIDQPTEEIWGQKYTKEKKKLFLAQNGLCCRLRIRKTTAPSDLKGEAG